MKDDIIGFVAVLLSIAAGVFMFAVTLFAIGMVAKILWIPISIGWGAL